MRHFINNWQIIKRRKDYLKLGQPLFTKHAQGAVLVSTTQKRYIDFLMGWGTIILGHNDSAVRRTIEKYLKLGLSFNTHHKIEILLAQNISDFIPFPCKVGYFINGTDATSAAARVARAFTKKEIVILTGFHGWNDWSQPNSGGVPKEFRKISKKIKPDESQKIFEFIKKNRRNLACVVVEIPMRVPDEAKVVQEIKRLSIQYNFLLIFDEIKSGLRLGFTHGISLFYKVNPDMMVFGKAFGGGLPLSILVGRREFFNKLDNVQLSATFWGFPLSLFVAQYLIQRFRQDDLSTQLKKQSEYFVKNFNEIFFESGIDIQLDQYYTMPMIISHEKKRLFEKFYRLSFNNGLYIRPNHCWFLSLAHTREVIDRALEKFKKIVNKL